MDGNLLLLFILATFFGGFVSGFSGFAMGLVVSGIWLHHHADSDRRPDCRLRATHARLRHREAASCWRDIWPLTLGTPSAVSHAIRKLEGALSTTLFERGARAVRLTPAGENLMRHAGSAFRRTAARARGGRRFGA
jgi:hypothetical protein